MEGLPVQRLPVDPAQHIPHRHNTWKGDGSLKGKYFGEGNG